MSLKTIKQIKNLKNKTVLLRGDLDVVVKNGRVMEDLRLRRMIPSIEYLFKKNAKIIIMGHIGRPEGKVNLDFSLEPVFKKLKTFFPKRKFIFIEDLYSKEGLESVKRGEAAILENLRFYPGEETNDPNFAKILAQWGDIYVNECFSTTHRKHASFVGITKYLPSCGGLNLMQEIKALSGALNKPKFPAIAILGGAKIETKLPLIEKMSKKFDYVLVGGRLGLEIDELCKLRKIKKFCSYFTETGLKKLGTNIILPIDYNKNFDLGPKTITQFVNIIQSAKTIIWNGPVGKIEEKDYVKGTQAIAKAIIKSGACSIVGGGDTIALLDNIKLLNKFDFVSTGGGAMLQFMEKGTLIGIEALEKNKVHD